MLCNMTGAQHACEPCIDLRCGLDDMCAKCLNRSKGGELWVCAVCPNAYRSSCGKVLVIAPGFGFDATPAYFDAALGVADEGVGSATRSAEPAQTLAP